MSAPHIIEFPYQFEPLFRRHDYLYIVMAGGRNGVKSHSVALALVEIAAKESIRIVCARQTQASIRESVHHLLESKIVENKLPNYDIQQATIINTKTGSQFIFVGLSDPDSLKSIEACDILWVEEAVTVPKKTWDKVLPTIRKQGACVWLTYNPELDTDYTHTHFWMDPPAKTCKIFTTYLDIPRHWVSEITWAQAEECRIKRPDEYRHIWLGETRSALTGAIFAEEIKVTMAENRICEVPYDRTKPVHTAWDLGKIDHTAIWFYQAYGGFYNFIDYHQDNHKTLELYIIDLQRRGYMYGTDWLPWDGHNARLHKGLTGAVTLSPDQMMRNAGRQVRTVPDIGVWNRINAARTKFPQCRFDRNKCQDGLQALRHYRWEDDNRHGGASAKPVHDEYSHGASAFTYAAVAMDQPNEAKQKPPFVFDYQTQRSQNWM